MVALIMVNFKHICNYLASFRYCLKQIVDKGLKNSYYKGKKKKKLVL